MDDSKQRHQGGDTNAVHDNLESKKQDFLKLHAEYLAAQALVQQKQKKVENLTPQYEKFEADIFELKEYRNELNLRVRKQGGVVKKAEVQLANAKALLERLRSAVIQARDNVKKAKRDTKPFYNQWQLSQTELQNAEKTLVESFEKVKLARQEYILAGGKLTSEEKSISVPEAIAKDNPNNPWKSGTFYLFALLVIIGVIVLLTLSLPWYTISLTVIAALLFLIVIGALQLRNDKNLSDESFMELMIEVLRQLPFLKKS